MIEYNKRLVEVDEVLKHLPREDLLKIPENVRKSIKDNKDKEYIWEFDETKSLKDQNLSRDTIAILSCLNMEYLLNNEQKALMEKIHRLNAIKEKEIEESSGDKHGIEDLFMKENNKSVNNVGTLSNHGTDEISIAVPTKGNFLKKIIDRIKTLLINK